MLSHQQSLLIPDSQCASAKSSGFVSCWHGHQVYTDVALDPYNSDGHDGIVRDDGVILNDETVEYLCRQAVSQVRAWGRWEQPSLPFFAASAFF